MRFARQGADEELLADLGVGQPGGDEPENLDLAGSERRRHHEPRRGRSLLVAEVRLDEPAGGSRLQQGVAAGDGPDRVDERSGYHPLDKKAAGSGPEDLDDVLDE